MLFQTGGMLQEQRGLINSVMKKGIQHSTKTPIKMPTIKAAFFSFCSLHVSPSVWKVIAAWRAVNTICGSCEASFTSKQKQTRILNKTICLRKVLFLNDSTTSVHLPQKAATLLTWKEWKKISPSAKSTRFLIMLEKLLRVTDKPRSARSHRCRVCCRRYFAVYLTGCLNTYWEIRLLRSPSEGKYLLHSPKPGCPVVLRDL